MTRLQPDYVTAVHFWFHAQGTIFSYSKGSIACCENVSDPDSLLHAKGQLQITSRPDCLEFMHENGFAQV